MSDTYWGQITIGGHHTPQSFKKLTERLKNIKGTASIEVTPMFDGAVSLSIQDSDAPNGSFEKLEGWLTEEKIPWRRDSDGYDMGDIAPESAWWVEGMEDFECVMTTDDHEPIVDFKDLTRMVSALAGKSPEDLPAVAASSDEDSWEGEFAREGLSSATDLATFLKKKLDKMCIPEAPDLSVKGMTAKQIIKSIEELHRK